MWWAAGAAWTGVSADGWGRAVRARALRLQGTQ